MLNDGAAKSDFVRPRLLTLPRELRDQILEDALLACFDVQLRSYSEIALVERRNDLLSLLHINEQLRDELLDAIPYLAIKPLQMANKSLRARRKGRVEGNGRCVTQCPTCPPKDYVTLRLVDISPASSNTTYVESIDYTTNSAQQSLQSSKRIVVSVRRCPCSQFTPVFWARAYYRGPVTQHPVP